MHASVGQLVLRCIPPRSCASLSTRAVLVDVFDIPCVVVKPVIEFVCSAEYKQNRGRIFRNLDAPQLHIAPRVGRGDALGSSEKDCFKGFSRDNVYRGLCSAVGGRGFGLRFA